MPQWIHQYHVPLLWLAGVSVVLFVGSLLLVPALVVRIPPDYFAHEHRPAGWGSDRHAIVRTMLMVGKNVLGWIFILAGIAMLVLPGQGLLTIVIGFLMLDFPGKYRLEKWLISRRRVLSALNWYRQKRGKGPLRTDRGATQPQA